MGSDLARYFEKEHEVVVIDKDTYADHKGRSYDVLINANGNSRRFFANEHPLEDFRASTLSVFESIIDFPSRRYVYISSSDVYEDHASPVSTREDQVINPQHLSPYGFHKYLSEQLVKKYAKEFLIVRSSAMLGAKLQKGPIFDVLHGKPLFITRLSRIQFILTDEVARVIDLFMKNNRWGETVNVGGRGAVSFEHIENIIPGAPAISAEAETQEYEMNVEKLSALYRLKTSEEYLKDFIAMQANGSRAGQ